MLSLKQGNEMAKMTQLTHERVLEVLDYDPATGVFTWKVSLSNRTKVGDRAGVVSGNYGHRFITIDGEKLQASRLAVFYARGEWPSMDVKFLNGEADDCSWNNLQEMSRIEAARLRDTLSTNTSGVRGVSPAKNNRWKAAITANYQQVNLGVYPTKEEASEVYEFAMSALRGAVTPDECAAALATVIQFRRKKVAWNRLLRSGRRHVWPNFDEFSSAVGELSEEQTTIAAMDEGRPIGAENFKWLAKVGGGGFDKTTKEGRAAYMRAYREANPGRWRHQHLVKNYGIDEVEYQQMIEKQGGEFCVICEKLPSDERLAVDHDHDSGLPRGLICKSCNYGIGQLGDDAQRVRRAAEYLESKVVKVSDWDRETAAAIARSPHRDWLNVATPGFGVN